MSRPSSWREISRRFSRVARHIVPTLTVQRRLVAGSCCALVASTLLGLLEPWPLKLVVDHLNGNGPVRNGTSTDTLLAAAALGVVLIHGLRAATEYFQAVGFAIVGNRALNQLRLNLFHHLQQLPLAYHDRARNGDLVVRVTGDINQLKDIASTAILPLVANGLLVGGMLLVMLWMHWQLTLIALATLPLFGIFTLRLSGQIHQAASKQRRREGDLAATTAESLAAIRQVQAGALESVFAEKFGEHTRRSLKQGVKTSRLSAGLERSIDLVTSVATAAVLWYGARLVQATTLSLGDLIVFLAYLKRCFRPLRDVAKYSARLAKATAAGERVIAVLDQPATLADPPGAPPAPRLIGDIQLQHVTYRYASESPSILDDVSLQIRAGSMVAIVGESGVGKSTLLSLLMRFDDPTSGVVRIDGHDIRQWQLGSLRNQMAIVLQDATLFAGTIYDNLVVGMSDVPLARVEAASRQARAHEFILRLPNGYGTEVGERGMMLSRGQRQRLAIARALLRDAPLVLLDEPLTGLDPENSAEVAQALRQLTRGRTTLLVTHDPDHAALADVVYRIDQGRLVELCRSAPIPAAV